MAVVPLVGDVLADVVEEARVLEELAIVVGEAVELAQLVEQLEREHRDVTRVRLGPRAAAGERLDGGPPDRERIVGPVGRVVATDGVEDHPLAQGPLADREVLDLEELHRQAHELDARDDEVDALGVETGHLLALGAGGLDEVGPKGIELGAGEREVVERRGHRLVAARCDHVAEVLDRAAAADGHLRLEGRGLDRTGREHVEDVLAQPAPVTLVDAGPNARTRR